MAQVDFTTRLTNWLTQQAEYPTLFLADRPTRRRAAKSLAKHVLTLPVQAETGGPNRATVRAAVKARGRAIGDLRGKFSKREQRLMRKAERDRARYLRMSDARREQLEQRYLLELALAEQSAAELATHEPTQDDLYRPED